MTDGVNAHVSPAEIEAYFASTLSDDRQRTIEEHLAVCDSCTRAAREARALEALWQWTAEEHGELYQREILEGILEAVQAAAPQDVRERLRRWQRQGVGWAEAALHIVLEGSRATAERMDAFVRPQSKWRFDIVPQAVPVRGAESAPSSSILLSTEASAGAPPVRVAVRAGADADVVVRVDALGATDSLPLVLLVDTSEAIPKVRVSRVVKVEGQDHGIARFDGLEAGAYLLLFAPLDDVDSA